MKVAVTGCNGRVGRRVVKLALERGYTVVGIDVAQASPTQDPWLINTEYTFKQADLQDFDVVLDVLADCEAVITLAACPNPGDYKVNSHNNNVIISWNILRACAELGINKVAQASSVNVMTMCFSQKTRLHYLPIDELHPCEPDEPYGLSKVISEMQADTIVRRYESMKIASLRLSWSIPQKSIASKNSENRAKDLWAYVQEDSGAQAFILAIEDNERWSGHERFFIAAPHTAVDEETRALIQKHYPDVPVKEGKELAGTGGLFDCSKAATLLGWHHSDELSQR
jgi:nucleoside-diphosphate-sugar epimerase